MTDRSHAHRFGPSHTAGKRVADSCPGRRQDRADDIAARGEPLVSSSRGYQFPVSPGSMKLIPVPWRQGPRDHPRSSHRLNQYDPERLDQRAPSIPIVRWDLHAAQSTSASVSNISRLPSRYQTVPALPAQTPASLLPAESAPESRPRPTLGSSRRSIPRRAGSDDIPRSWTQPMPSWTACSISARATDGPLGFDRDHARSIRCAPIAPCIDPSARRAP